MNTESETPYVVSYIVKCICCVVATVHAILGFEIREDFTAVPIRWRSVEATTLFVWHSRPGEEQVTWDSSQPNSYYYLPLGMTLTRTDDFAARFTLSLRDIAIGVDPSKPSTFQIAIGFINLTNAFDPNLNRGSGINGLHGARNLIEFDYFADSGFGATIAPTIVSKDNQFAYSHNFPLEITPGDTFEIEMSFSAASATLTTRMWKNGEVFGPADGSGLKAVTLGSQFSDFAVNAFAVSSYSDAGQSPPQFAGSVLAHGSIDNVLLTLPDPPECSLHVKRENGTVTIRFNTDAKWHYTIQKSADLKTWADFGTALDGSGDDLTATDWADAGEMFYRVKLEEK
jgi:hypothetical protein